MGMTYTPAVAGGPALYIDYPLTLLDNTNGMIGGGGGGGGGSAEVGGSNNNNAPGSGGAGIAPGAGGSMTWSAGYMYYPKPGTETAGGLSGYSGNVGRGGNLGSNGYSGGPVGSTTNYYSAGATGGYSIYGTSKIQASIGLDATRLFGITYA